MERLSIDLDNLCSFMPQDRVGQFTQLNAKEVMENTLKTIKTGLNLPNLFEEQQLLSDIEKQKLDCHRNKETKQNAVDTLEREVEAMRADIERLERRKITQRVLELYEIKMLLKVDATEQQEKDDAAKVRYDAAANLLAEEQKKIEPLTSRERDLKRGQAQKDRNAESATKKLQAIEKNLNAENEYATECDVDVENAANDIVSLDRQRRNNEEALNREIERKEKEKANLEAIEHGLPALTQKLEELKAQLDSFMEVRNNAQEALQELEQQFAAVQDRIRGIHGEINGLQDLQQVYRSRLLRQLPHASNANRQIMEDTIKAMEFLNQNMDRFRETGKVRGEVLGPG